MSDTNRHTVMCDASTMNYSVFQHSSPHACSQLHGLTQHLLHSIACGKCMSIVGDKPDQ
jgi:hypothetical protein